MKLKFLLIISAMATMALPSAQVHSQALRPPTADPMTALQNLLKANDDLLKRQDAILKELVDLNTTAHEARIFSKRG